MNLIIECTLKNMKMIVTINISFIIILELIKVKQSIFINDIPLILKILEKNSKVFQ